MAKQRSKNCPECKTRFRYASVAAHRWFPFCSERCKVIDLGRWFKNEYAFVEDLSRGQDIKEKFDIDLDDPDVKAALDELEGN